MVDHRLISVSLCSEDMPALRMSARGEVPRIESRGVPGGCVLAGGSTHPAAAHALLGAQRVLAVVAHPDDESFGLGALLSTVTEAGGAAGVLCFTHGEASTLHEHGHDLHATRPQELDRAARELGVGWVRLLDYGDAQLSGVPLEALRGDTLSAIADFSPELIVLLDENGVTGHHDHVRATLAGLMAARATRIEAVAWSLPDELAAALNREFGASFCGRPEAELGAPLIVDRSRQLRAIAEHRTQSAHNPVLWRRLELQGAREWLRRLYPRPIEPVDVRAAAPQLAEPAPHA